MGNWDMGRNANIRVVIRLVGGETHGPANKELNNPAYMKNHGERRMNRFLRGWATISVRGMMGL